MEYSTEQINTLRSYQLLALDSISSIYYTRMRAGTLNDKIKNEFNTVILCGIYLDNFDSSEDSSKYWVINRIIKLLNNIITIPKL